MRSGDDCRVESFLLTWDGKSIFFKFNTTYTGGDLERPLVHRHKCIYHRLH